MIIYPFEIDELIAAHGNVSLSALRPLVQAGRPFTCPQCSGDGRVPTVPVDEDNPLDLCPLCDGFGKTAVEYQSVCAKTEYRQVMEEPK